MVLKCCHQIHISLYHSTLLVLTFELEKVYTQRWRENIFPVADLATYVAAPDCWVAKEWSIAEAESCPPLNLLLFIIIVIFLGSSIFYL